ncbi:MAG: glycoside hydrolase [Phycisphaerae bacterium]
MSRICLDGTWQVSDGENQREAVVPGLAGDPKQVHAQPIRYRRRVELPGGDWTEATLTLKGARFAPKVFVDGRLVSSAPGGMAPTTHLLPAEVVGPGRTVELEIELAGLDDIPADDASKIPPADRWRSNISSCLWDSAVLRTHRGARLERVIPFGDPLKAQADVRWQFQRLGFNGEMDVKVEVLDGAQVLCQHRIDARAETGSAVFDLPRTCLPWSPESPNLYTLRVSLLAGQDALDTWEMAFAPRRFEVAGKGFVLNGQPITLRAGSVVWHRWIRDPEANELGFDIDWFERNIVDRLKSHGANTLRFHLGSPPEAMLDLCDRKGLCVQLEWLFFHGMAASRRSLVDQWRSWLDLAAKHPSVVLIHPWNETEGEQLDTAFGALETLAPEYPPMIVSHRDVLHVHKYWWSLFENVGVYYDTAEQFDQPIMVDEFGGNYLDGQCDPGGYPTLVESFLRFLGPGHTAEERLELNTLANCRVAEYWRRIGAAGFSPFCIAGSWEDGNHHFLGPLSRARPKPVWDALTAAYAPVSVSLDCWDRNFRPGRQVDLPVMCFNDTWQARSVRALVRLDRNGQTLDSAEIERDCDAFSREETTACLQMPDQPGPVELAAELTSGSPGVDRPVVSRWSGQVIDVQLPEVLSGRTVGLSEDEQELAAWLGQLGLATCPLDDAAADVILGSGALWSRLAGTHGAEEALTAALRRGAPAVLLDAGPRPLGQGYLDGDDLGPLQGSMWIETPARQVFCLPMGVGLEFVEMPEPESCLHPTDEGAALWQNLPRRATQLWNGYRGGLIVPAVDMHPSGLCREAFVELWVGRGADAKNMQSQQYLAYELAGFYAFADQPDEQVRKQLREKVRFLVDDAPALAGSVNPNAPIQTTDLAAEYDRAAEGQARRLISLARCGKNLTRTPVLAIDFGPATGLLLLSQLLTAGRLAEGFGTAGRYGVRRDPAASQMVLNMIAYSLQARESQHA